MSIRIKAEKLNNKVLSCTGGITSQKLLVDEIPGVETNYVIIAKGCEQTLISEGKRIRVVFFIAGLGNIKTGDRNFQLNEMSLFYPLLETPFTICASGKDIEYLEIIRELSEEDLTELSMGRNQDPLFVPYSECETYREAIKSEKTINRTIIKEGLIPRLCMGSVETEGPDVVGEHEHPMLEQYFYGLPDNNCFVRADHEEIPFEENTLLHIPLGSMHGARVEEGHRLHYLWIDLFRTQDMSYISSNHISECVE